MTCINKPNRIVQVGWLETTANTGLLYPNENGCVYIALGSNDTVGAVIIEPQIAQESSSLRPYIVAAGAPFIGHIKGPFKVKPIFAHVFAPTYANVLDLLIFEDFPPFAVEKRAPLLVALRAAGTTTPAISANVRGRARVTVSIRRENAVGAGDTFAISGYQIAASEYGIGATAANIAVQTGAYAAVTANQTHEFSPTAGLPAGAYPGNDSLDFVIIQATSATEAGIYALIVQAWD
jgi:hypothetical protein